MNALTDGDLTIGDELPPKILESCLSLLSMASHRDVAPGGLWINLIFVT
jgi:hypothetical protein